MDIHYGAAVQNFFTLMKVSLIAFFGFSGLFSGPSNANPVWFPGEVSLWDSNFAGGLIGVYFAYSGWNAAVYLADEIENPRRNIPLALLNGTLIVTGLYLLLCYVFIKTVPLAALQGKVEVGYLAAVAIFGQTWGSLLTLVISLALVSSVSAMIMAGPRVMQAVGEDFPIFRQLARRNTAGVPAMAILLQSAIAVLLLLTARAGQILNFVGVTLSIFAFLSVLGVIITRMRGITTAAESYRLPGYPVVPIIFLAMNGGLIYGAFANKDSFYPSFSGVMLVLLGIVIYMGFRNEKKV
jgi:APA family basic amino acid/polyamine antiporter